MKRYIAGIVACMALAGQVMAYAGPEGFVRIQGTMLDGGNVRLEDFEILDHPVANQEYKLFVDATGHVAPLHWREGKIPAGKEHHPVVFVNRQDVKAYLGWLTESEDRVYRLPTEIEFEYAQRGGMENPKYPWGDADPAGRANYDAEGTRAFDRWEDYLAPARSGEPNGYGLYGMAGNVWQMTVTRNEPATMRWVYRLEDPELKGQRVMGGSWARAASYLRCGVGAGLHAGLRHPDAGFRPVRAPEGEDWTVEHRGLSGLSRGQGEILLTWALIEDDTPGTRWNVYRGTNRDHAGVLVSRKPTRSTSFVDSGVKADTRYQYYVRPVNRLSKEGKRSEWVGVTATKEQDSVLTTFTPLYKQGALVPIFGELDGDGALDCVVRMDNGNTEMSQDPGLPIQLEAFTSYGRSLWRKDICYHDHCYGSANNNPFNVWDMDGDGKAEVICRLQIGDEVFVAILDGMSGDVKHKAPWVPLASDWDGSSTRIHLSIAYLDGVHPAVVTQSGLYENETFTAYDATLKMLWQYKSFAETSGSGGHKIEVADVNGDGKQEVFDGTTCLNSDGTLRWSIYRQHPDIVSIQDYIPERPGLEVFYIVESSIHAGVYMVDANSGEVIWKVNREDDPAWTHGHSGWTSDIWDGSPGIECVSNRAGHSDRHYLLFSASGTLLMEPFPAGFAPFEWDGDATRELLSDNGKVACNFDGKEAVPAPGPSPNPLPDSQFLMVADLYGDFRDELVLVTETESGGKALAVVASPEPMDVSYATPRQDRGYRLWLGRNMGGGYRSVYDRTLTAPGEE